MSEVNRYKVVKMLSEDGNHIGYTPHGPEIVLASSYDELIAENEKLKADLREAKDAKLGLSWAIGEIKAENEKLLARDKMHIEHFNALSDFKQRTVDAFDAKIYTLNEEIEDLLRDAEHYQWQSMESCPAHKDVLFYREDAGVFTGQLTYCESFMSEKEVEESGLDEETLYLEDVFSFGPDGAYRCDGDLVPTNWMPFPSEPSE